MNKTMVQPLKAFLCHASGDKPAVREMYKRLVFEGVDAWLDKEKLLPGQDWRVEIPKAVQEADVVIVFLSNKSVSKEGYVQKEIKFALDIAEEKPEGTIFLIPARLEECAVPERLSRWQWVDLFEENGFVQLLRSLKLRARAVGATVEPASYEDVDRETAQRVDQLYTEGLAAFYTEDWDRACQRFRTILSEQPGHKNATEKLAEAEKQRSLTRLYARAEGEYKAENWAAVIQSLEDLLEQGSEYKEAAHMLKNAKKKKRLGELYVEAKALHLAQKWQAVTKVFEQIFAIDPACPDPDNLLPSAQKEVAELKRIADLNERYSLAVRRMDAGEWLEARTLLEKVHKSQTGFLETERLLRKAEDEITKVEEQNRRKDQVNLLYEQAHGLVRSKNWRKALDKMEEIQRLDSQFEDRDGITAQAKAELACEEQEIQRQNELAAVYAESVRLMQGGQYQDALDKWEEVRKIDSKYPDRQGVQKTAKKKLAEMTKPVKVRPRPAMKKPVWMGVAVFAIVAVGIAGIALLVKFGQQMLSTSMSTPIQTTAPFFASTKVSIKTSTAHPTTSIPATGGYTDPAMYDDFSNSYYDSEYNVSLWDYAGESNKYTISQEDGKLSITVYDKAGAGLSMKHSSGIIRPFFFEARLYLDPYTTNNGTHFYVSLGNENGHAPCGIFRTGDYAQQVVCWGEYYGEKVESNFSISGILPGWHIFRYEVDPETMIITFIVDGIRLGSYNPSDEIPSHFDEFQKSSFDIRIVLNNFGPSNAPVGYVDYVRKGAIEDDLAAQEPFFWAVGEWGATDVDDGSLMTMTIRRISAGKYTFVYMDQATEFCDGGSGNAKFQANTLSNIADASIELVCDAADRSGQTVYKLIYDRVHDQIADSTGATWNRKK